uniref:EF-hand domain-containing protein n=1 Tax=Glossina palpalis gambiensis TaxID=67801 RepID=A0A1B0BT37_9MUSC
FTVDCFAFHLPIQLLAVVGDDILALPKFFQRYLLDVSALYGPIYVFDRYDNGFISRDEIQTAMEMIGEPLNEQQLNQLLAIADLDRDGRINYEGTLEN